MWDWQHKGKTWSWCIRSILKETKQGDVIVDLNEDVDFNTLFDKAEKELMSIEIDRWKKELLKQPKLRFYRNFKQDFNKDNYVLMCVSKSFRSFIGPLRSGVLPLKVEIGRFSQKS